MLKVTDLGICKTTIHGNCGEPACWAVGLPACFSLSWELGALLATNVFGGIISLLPYLSVLKSLLLKEEK